MKILITGTAGFIGFHLANKLLALGHEVHGIDNINDYYDVQLKYRRLEYSGIDAQYLKPGDSIKSFRLKDYTFSRLNLEDKEGINKVFKKFKPDVVVNLAAQAGVRYSITNPDVYISANIQGFLNILEACRNYPVDHLLYASSSSVYGLNTQMPFSTEHNVDHPISLYAASKKANELMAHTYSHLYGIPSTGLRFFTVYGPWGRPDMALFIFTKAILNNQPIQVFNHGNMERDFTYVSDIVGGIERMISNPPSESDEIELNQFPATSTAAYKIYNIGNSRPVKLMDFIRAIEQETGKEAIIEYKPLQAGDVEKTWADVEDLIANFGYKPVTPVAEGISNFVKWYREYYSV
jgi:UDP-glucuronate 4-epimerase